MRMPTLQLSLETVFHFSVDFMALRRQQNQYALGPEAPALFLGQSELTCGCPLLCHLLRRFSLDFTALCRQQNHYTLGREAPTSQCRVVHQDQSPNVTFKGQRMRQYRLQVFRCGRKSIEKENYLVGFGIFIDRTRKSIWLIIG